MLSDYMKRSLRRQMTEQLTETRRQKREQEQRLARLKFEWNIAKRLRRQARSEDEREKWHVQSDAAMGLVLQQEDAIKEIEESIQRQRSRLDELNAQLSDEAEP